MPTKHIADERLVELIRTGQHELYAQIIKRYQAKLIRYVEYLITDSALSSDAVQESLSKAYINLHGFNTQKKFSSWIYRIAHNEAMSIIKKYRLHQDLELASELSDQQINIEEDFVRKESIAQVKRCLGQIPLLYREPLSLFYLEEKSYQEISDILHIPIGTVGTRINRAKIIAKKICQNQ